MERTIDDVLVDMDRRLDRAVEENDPRGHFGAVYRAVTARVRDGIEADEFDDGARMERFDVAFADLYLDAAHRYDLGGPVSVSWRTAFDHAGAPLIVLQHVLMGMNAHINLDLGIAAARTSPGATIHELEHDFERLNDVLAAMVDRMQDAIAVVSPWTTVVDRLGGRLDELLSCWSVSQARGAAWRFAQQLAVSPDPDRAITERDRRVAGISATIARPRPVLRSVIAAAHRRERRDVGAVIDVLRSTG